MDEKEGKEERVAAEDLDHTTSDCRASRSTKITTHNDREDIPSLSHRQLNNEAVDVESNVVDVTREQQYDSGDNVANKKCTKEYDVDSTGLQNGLQTSADTDVIPSGCNHDDKKLCPIKQPLGYTRSLDGEVTQSILRRRDIQSPAAGDKASKECSDVAVASNVSLADRLSSLQHSEKHWQSRVPLRESNSRRPASRPPVSIADRLSQLSEAQQTWTAKVKDKDVKKYTADEKLGRLNDKITDSPLLHTPRRPPRQNKSKDELPVATEASVGTDDDSEVGTTAEPSTAEEEPVTVEIPRIDDDDLSAFFITSASVSQHPEQHEKEEASIDTFNDIFIDSNDMLEVVRRPKPKRSKVTARNPVKTLSMRVDIQQTYRERKPILSPQDVRQVTQMPQFDEEALAGLASTENFRKVALCKVDSVKRQGNFQPFTEKMLLQVKGRRYCQTRLVEPRPESVNRGDCFVLVTPDCVWLWIGEFSNVIERAKAAEVASQIHQRHDLGIRATSQLTTIHEEKCSGSGAVLRFWNALGANEIHSATAPSVYEEDELYEEFVCETNLVYEAVGDSLVEVEKYSRKPLKYHMLQSSKVFVFDFGSEMYVWTGKRVPLDVRRRVVKLADERWRSGYDYSEFPVNPLCPLTPEDAGGLCKQDSTRPKWTVFGKVSQNMETVPFREKFVDWPDASRLIRVRPQKSDKMMNNVSSAMQPCDVSLMISPLDVTPVTLLLQGSNVGRGDKWEDYEDGLHREFEIITHSVDVWHVSEYSRHRIDEASHGQFHDEDAYVVCWHYAITQITHTLSGQESQQPNTGWSRCVYFFWHGRQCGVGEKGASALMAVELDKEKGPQVPVLEGKEPPCFIRLFNGHMIIHSGKREEAVSRRWRLYMLRNELPLEAYLWEIPTECRNLRSRASFVLVDCEKSVLYVWHGTKSSLQSKQRVVDMANWIIESCPAELGISSENQIVLSEMHEGAESTEFWEGMGGRKRLAYDSLLIDSRSYVQTPKLFHMTSSSSSTFDVTEILNPSRSEDDEVCSLMPFLQEDLYAAQQPALFLVDDCHRVYLWIGQRPTAADSDDIESVVAGTANARFTAAKICAMQTALSYCSEKYGENAPSAVVVNAGSEPLGFINLFPFWQTDTLAVSRAHVDEELVSDALAKLTDDHRYSLSELQQRPLPEGVDAQRLETYLGDEEFQEVFNMGRKEFADLPGWKQLKLKKAIGLF